MRNIKILKKFIEEFPDKNWNIYKLIYGDLNTNIPLIIIENQVNEDDFHLLVNNSHSWSITSIDFGWESLYLDKNLEIEKLVYLLNNNLNFNNYFNEIVGINKLFKLISLSPNISINLIDNNLNNSWCWDNISSNNIITVEWLKYFPNQEWSFEKLLSNSNFDLSWLEYFPERLFDWRLVINSNNFTSDWIKYFKLHNNCNELSRHNNFSLEWVSKYPNGNWSWRTLSYNKNFNFSWIDRYPEKKWDYKYLLNNRYFKIEYLTRYKFNNIDISNLLTNPNFRINWLDKIPSKYRIFRLISHNTNLSINWLLQYPNEDWDFDIIMFDFLSQYFLDINLLIFLADKIKNSSDEKKKVFWKKVSTSNVFDIKWVKLFPLADWNWNYISNNPNLTVNWIVENPDYNWNFDILCCHKNLTISELIDLSKKKNLCVLNWDMISKNPNLTLDFVRDNIELINFNELSYNKFNGVYYERKFQQQEKEKQVNIIEEELIKKTWHPDRFKDWCLEYNFTI